MDEFQAQIEAIGGQLRAKISSKFQTSTFLAGFAFTILGVQISELWQDRIPQLLSVSIAFMIVSITLYICAIVKLDELTMPKWLWKEDESNLTTSSIQMTYLTHEDLKELRKRMVFFWMWLTFVATILTASSLLLMLLPLRTQELNTPGVSDNLLRQTFSRTIIALALTIVYLIILSFVAKKTFKPYMKVID